MTNHFKKFIATVALSLVTACCVQAVAPAEPAEAADVKIIIDGETVSSDVAPQIINSRTMVPIRVISENLNASVYWNGNDRSITVSKGSTTMVLYADKTNYTLNGASQTLDVPATIVNGRTLVPLRVISEALDCGVEWDNGTVYVSQTVIQVNAMDAGQYVNLRSGPGTSYSIVGKVYGNQYLQVLRKVSGEGGDWYKIETANDADAYVASWLVSVYTGSNQTTTPTPDPDEPSGEVTTGDSNGTLTVTNRNTSVTGQSSISFDIGNGSPSVVSNDGNQLVVKISGAHINGGTWQPAENMSPFNGFKVENSGSNDVLMTCNVTDNGYFRLDINGSTFTVTAVAKHKNGTTGLAGKVIVVSAGHGVYGTGGAIDRGAVSTIYPSFDEVDFNTYVAQKLRDKLSAAGATVIMIREDENPIDMTLYERSVIANDANADAFIEIHGDSAGNASASGIGTWAFTDNFRLTTAAQKDMRNEFATVMNSAMASATGEPAYVKYSNFSVLRETEVPCVLIECGFLSNQHDLALLKSPDYWEKLAQGMYNGLYNFFAY